MKIDLTGKVALVTGGTGDLGRVMVRTLAECGADVVINYHSNEKKAKELLEEVLAMGKRSVLCKGDITKMKDVLTMKEKVLHEFGTLDILVANAVIQYSWKNILEQSPEDYLSQFNSCVMQSVYLAKAFVPMMIEKNCGRIIGINSESSMQAFVTQSAYVAGKRGMDGIYRVLAKEVGEHQITVNQVAPGWTISDRDRVLHSEHNEGYEKTVPLKRRGTDQEIANVVAFLASDLSSFITGAYIPVSGGNVMPGI